MRRLLSFFLLGIATVAGGQTTPTIGKPDRSLKSVMIDDLADPKVQTALDVTSIQLQLQRVRISREAMKLVFVAVRSSLDENGEAKGVNLTFGSNFAGGATLFPFLNEPQIAKLRRMAIRDLPLNALATDELAFALELTTAQRAGIDALRTKYYQGLFKSDLPSWKALKKGLAKATAISNKVTKELADSGEAMSVERLDQVEPAVMELFQTFETAIRLSAKEKTPAGPDPSKLLTAAQRRKLRQLSRV